MIIDGKKIPAEITVNLIKNVMIKAGWNEKLFLIDGFPMNLENYEVW